MILRRRRYDPSALSARPQTQDHAATPDRAWSVLLLVNDWIKHAETKLSILLAFQAALAAGLIATVLRGQPNGLGTLFTGGLAAAAIAISVGMALAGLIGRVKRRDGAATSVLYFGDIAAKYKEQPAPFRERLEAVLSDDDQLLAQTADQVHANAEIALRKYTWLNRATRVGGIALLIIIATGVCSVAGW